MAWKLLGKGGCALENIEIKLKKQDGRLIMEVSNNCAGSLYDNFAKQFIFTRPAVYADCNLTLLFRDEKREFSPISLGGGNHFAIPGLLTQTDYLQLQVVFERDGNALVHSNIVRFWLRPSLFNVGEPAGQPGQGTIPGQAATISVGTVTTGQPGSTAEVQNVGTRQDAIFDFVIPRGEQGPVGPQGPQGEQGPVGLQGPRGEQGERGADGTGVQILGTKNNPGQLPSSAQPGDAYLIDGQLWVWGGAQWANVGNIQGPQGIAGPQGERGMQGLQGDPGPQGERGEQGLPGPQGIQGDPGPAGSQGPQGEQGLQGPQGEQGPQGPQGQGVDAYSRSEADALFATQAALAGRLSLAGGNMSGALVAQSNSNYGAAQVRNAIISTSDLTPGVSALASGALYFVYE